MSFPPSCQIRHARTVKVFDCLKSATLKAMDTSPTEESDPTEADYGHVISNLEDELRRRLEELQRIAPNRKADKLLDLDRLR
jgi:hypothetical protein